MSKEQKIESKYVPQNITEIIALFTVVVTIATFLLRAYWYVYELGYFKAIGVDRIYIEAENIGNLYYLVDCIGLALILITSNYFTYLLVAKKKIKELLFGLFIEVILFWVVVFVYSNAALIDAIREMIKYGLLKEYLLLLGKVVLLVAVFNLYGLCFGITKIVVRKKPGEENNTADNQRKRVDIKIVFLFIVATIIVEGFVTFLIGVSDGNKQKSYKVIIEDIPLDDVEKVDKKYIFQDGDSKAQIYLVLYENNEKYIISNLYWDEKKIGIEKTHQKVIPKEGIETIYVEDIFAVEQSGNDENDETEIIEENGEKAEEPFAGAMIGAIVGGLIIYYVEERKRKKHNIILESHAAMLLYYDLKSIEQYITKEDKLVNLRYSNEWQGMVANCSFLCDKDIKYLYDIYEAVYHYHESFGHKIAHESSFEKEEIKSYKKLRELFWENDVIYVTGYKNVLEKLEKRKAKPEVNAE